MLGTIHTHARQPLLPPAFDSVRRQGQQTTEGKDRHRGTLSTARKAGASCRQQEKGILVAGTLI